EIKKINITKKIMLNTEKYIKKISEMSHRIEPHPYLYEVGKRLSELLSKQMTFGSDYGAVGKAGPLNPKAFPPCIKAVLTGMKSGGRNDAIILFLTPFISYARLYPSVFKTKLTKRVSDFDHNLST